MEFAKYLIAFVAVFNYGGLVADALVPVGAKQHMRNPLWPPHARFHNRQTMLIGIFNGSLSLLILFGSPSLTLPLLLISAAIAGSYFAAMAMASLFPGTAWVDPEFEAHVPRPLGLAPQQIVSYALCGLVLVAFASALLMR